MNPFDPAGADDLKRIFDKLPSDLKWDIVQFGCDLAGLVHPAADVASAFISLMRGDLLGAAVGVVSIIPVGDVLKLAKLPRYRAAVGRLLDLARADTELTRLLEGGMLRLRALVDRLPAGRVPELDGIRADIGRYFDRLQEVRKSGRFLPGTPVGGEKLKYVVDPLQTLYHAGQIKNAFRIPRQVADRIKQGGRTYKDFQSFQRAIWETIGNDPQLSRAFAYDPGNVARMRSGRAALIPKAPTRDLVIVDPAGGARVAGQVPNPRAVDKSGRIKGGEESFAIHHMTPIHDGGGVYDFDNLVICTPEYHKQSLLTPEYHYKRK